MKIIQKLSIVILEIITPFFLIMSAIRLLINPMFAVIEYNMPNFPEDIYGFTQADRIKWSHYAIDYLVHNEDISYLEELTFDDGTPLYIESELSHMEDVKAVVQAMILAWVILFIVMIGGSIWAWFGRWIKQYIKGLAHGAVITMILILMVFIFIAIGFNALFANFHKLFFAEGTWLFQYSDTLIRLFPMRFWQDAFIGVGIFTFLFSLGLLVIDKCVSPRINR